MSRLRPRPDAGFQARLRLPRYGFLAAANNILAVAAILFAPTMVSRPPIPNQRPAKFWNTKFLTGACQNRRLEQMELPARFGAAMSAAGIFNSKPATGVNDYVRRKFLPLPLLRAARLSECH
jgi:hypothetical protein